MSAYRELCSEISACKSGKHARVRDPRSPNAQHMSPPAKALIFASRKLYRVYYYTYIKSRDSERPGKEKPSCYDANGEKTQEHDALMHSPGQDVLVETYSIIIATKNRERKKPNTLTHSHLSFIFVANV